MNADEKTAMVHRHQIITAMRALALPEKSQRALTPSFVSDHRTMWANDYLDAHEHATAFQQTTGYVVYDGHVAPVLAQLATLIDRYQTAVASSQDIDELDRGWESIRDGAKRFLSDLRWHGPIDTEMFAYTDPNSGKRVVPRLPKPPPSHGG